MLYDKKKFEIAYNNPKLNFIYKNIEKIKNIKILELGVDQGTTTSLFLKLCEENNGKLISVDIKDCGHLYQNNRWNFIHSRDDDFEKINKEILDMGGLDILYIDSHHEADHVKKIFYHYYKLLNKGGFIFIDDVAWLPYAKSTNRESSGMYEANYRTFEKLLEIKFNNHDKFNLEFSFEESGTAKVTKIKEADLNQPKKIRKAVSLKNLLKTLFKNSTN